MITIDVPDAPGFRADLMPDPRSVRGGGGSSGLAHAPQSWIVMAALSGTAALGCGDKLLAVGRGVRFQRAYAAHQANLVIYSAGAQGGAALTNAKPIFVKPSKAEFAAAQKEYKFALKASADDFEYVAAIDEAMKLQLKTRTKS
jgi:hypothetical protein